jgi:hypothetical protein
VPLADTPPKHDRWPSPEQVNSRTAAFRRPTLQVLVHARTGMGELVSRPHPSQPHKLSQRPVKISYGINII